MSHARPGGRGFTIIELLVVIAIIGILSAIALAATFLARDRARSAAAKVEVLQIVRAMDAARFNTGKQYLKDITGSVCTSCGGAFQLKTSLAHIVSDGGNVYQGIDQISTDPWGQMYLLDENEGEGGSSDCRRDTLSAPGGSSTVTYNLQYGSAYCKAHPVGIEGFQ